MIITKDWLVKKDACQEGIKAFCNQKEKDSIKLIKLIIKSKNKEYLGWGNWLITKRMTKKQNISYAIYAAERVIKIFEDKYLYDQRPRNAIKAAKKYLQTADAAAYVADAAAAADAADDAADAAESACAAAAAYAYVADAAAADADDDAAAYASSEHKQLLIKILKNGLKIIEVNNG